MRKKQGCSDEEFIKYVSESFSKAQVLRKMGLVGAGGNYHTVNRRVKILGLDISHFTGQGHLNGKKHNWSKKTPLEEILVENSTYGGCCNNIKKKIFEAGLLKNQCYNCGLTKWLDQNIPLELEHKNGNRFDNRIENLTILCPNCHSLTDTYRGRGKGKKNKSLTSEGSDDSILTICYCSPVGRRQGT